MLKANSHVLVLVWPAVLGLDFENQVFDFGLGLTTLVPRLCGLIPCLRHWLVDRRYVLIRSSAGITLPVTKHLCSMDCNTNKLCGRPPQYSRPLQVDLWPFDFESGVGVTCDVGYLYVNFIFHRPLCSRLRPDVRDRQTDVRQMSDAHHRLMPLP